MTRKARKRPQLGHQRMCCPHCNTPAIIRDSWEVSEITREGKAICLNPECGHTWVFVLSALRTIAPSMQPNPRVFIPLSPRSPAAVQQAEQGSLPLALHHPR